MNAPLLAFDTSTERMAVALQAPAGLLTWDGPGGAAASAELIPRIQGLMRQAGLGFGELKAIAFGQGPGAFTGLRTACAVAQGLAFGASLPVLAVDSLMIVAEAARATLAAGWVSSDDFEVHVAMDARMGEIYAGRYRWCDARWWVRVPPALLTLQALNAQWQLRPPTAVAGSALQAFGERLCAGAAQRCACADERAAALMRLAQQAWADGLGIDAAQALPLYLRDKVASTLVERQAMRQPGVDK